MENTEEIKEGDIVVLKSDTEERLKMTVTRLLGKSVVCCYVHPESLKVYEEDYRGNGIPICALRKINS